MNEPPICNVLLIRIAWLLGATTIVSACASAPTHYHSLAQTPQKPRLSTRQPDPTSCTFDRGFPGSTIPTDTILLAHLAVPAQADRMQLSVHQTPTRLTVYESERWAAPLADQISAVLISNLRDALPGLRITSDPLLTGRGAPLQLHIDIEELDAILGKEATVRGRWRLSGTDTSEIETGACTSKQVLPTADIDELVLAWSRGLTDISSALALSIQHWSVLSASQN